MNIALWGTGNFGKYVQQQLKKNKNYSIKYFVDSNELLWGQKINGIEVISPEKLQNIFIEELEFVLITFINGITIYEKLFAMKIGKFGIVHNRVFDLQLDLEKELYLDKNIFWYDSFDLSRPLMRTLETNIVDDCNLNCRGCSHFSNLFKHGEKVPFDTFCSDLRQVKKHVDIYQFNMLGGEALLDRRITDYINFVRKILPNSKIQLISNGLLIPKQTPDFFECCKENNIRVIVSAYKPTLLLKDKIIGILEKNQVEYSIRVNREEFGKNIDLAGMADKCEAVKKCRESRCQFLRYGKIYKCPFEALGNRFFEYYNLDIRFHGGFDIYDENLNWNVLVDDLAHKPVEACRFCGEEEKIEWCVTNSPALEDWVVRNES
ncbi:MAG: 4Fe-4S cluster-binding domain-containing protein [Lachnospiraceae bacterium]|nr:4Fe-4S cluster-binding domain-containing protein [Lachnospiraceae bacterium]